LKDDNKIETVDDVNGVFGLLGVVIKDGSSVESTSSQDVELPGGPSTGVEGGKPSKTEREDGEPSLDVLTDQSKLAN
jgi:hypothetical protein